MAKKQKSKGKPKTFKQGLLNMIETAYNYPEMRVISGIFILILVVAVFFDGRDFTKKQLRFHQINFSEIDENSTFRIVATAYHVYLQINPKGEDFFTIGVATLPGCTGVYLTAPDLNASRYSWITPISSTIKGKFNKKQADYIKKCMIEDSASACHTVSDPGPPIRYHQGYKERDELFHVHRLVDASGEKCVYRMLRPQNPSGDHLERELNCGTWLTHFVRMGDDNERIASWIETHGVYMKPNFF